MAALVVASEAQQRARDVLCHAAWGARLTVDQFVAREARLRAHPWAKAAMTTWLWCDAAGEPLASCETFRMTSWLNGEPGESHGVASVFTEPALRGHGHASGMMQALVARLREEGPRAHASLLFSDVGARIYERAGYVAVPAPRDRDFTPEPGDPAESVDALFGEADLPAELPAAPPSAAPAQFGETGVITELPAAPPALPFVVWPTAAQLDWHLERERFYAATFRTPRPLAAGARAGRARAFWSADLKSDQLRVLLLTEVFTAAEATALLRAARRVAHAAGLARVVLWEDPLPFQWPDGADGGRLELRSGELPMLAPLAARVDPRAWTRVPRALWV